MTSAVPPPSEDSDSPQDVHGAASVLLWNDTDAETTRSISLDTLALAAEQAAVYSFWDNAMLPVMDGTYITPMLKPDTGTLLRITPYTGEAQVVGSNLHISCGTEEIADIRTGNGYMTIRLTDAGAREGSLFLNISGKKITGLECSGCEAEVCAADAVYPELRIRGRKRGTENLLKVTFA